MPTFPEQRLCFAFDGNAWQTVIKYDDHSYYHKRLEKLQGTLKGNPQGTKACDFVGSQDSSLYLIEVKDCAGYPENRPRLRGELPLEIALKVRDTVAGLSAGRPSGNAGEGWLPCAQLLTKRNRRIKVVLWLEMDLNESVPRHKQILSQFTRELEKGIATWFTDAKVLVVNQHSNPIPNLTVTRQQDGP